MAGCQDKQAEFRHNQGIFQHAEVYWGWGTPAGQRRGSRRIQAFLEFLRPAPGEKFLEIGCGKGWFTERMAACGARITAFDIQREFVETARQRIPAGHMKFLVADGEFLPFRDGSFDGTYGAVVLHHLPIENVLRELHRVLKPGGRLIYAEPNMLNPQVWLMKNVGWIGRRMGESPNETAFFKGQIRRLLERFGFEDIQIKPFDFLHPQTPEFLMNAVEKTGLFLERVPLVKEIAGSLEIRAVKAANRT